MKIKSRYFTILISIIGISLILISGCNKKPVPLVNTAEITSITRTTATCGGTITNDGGSIITNRGVCWSTDTIPVLSNSITSDGTGAGNFISVINGLTPNTIYFLRAYATNTAGTGYGSTMSFLTSNKVTDFDGNVYDTVRIGTQVWMKQNLKSIHYRNGDPIPNISDTKSWSKLKTGAYCDYENDPENGITYGHLYNFYAIVDSRNICPPGWHIPTDAEWTILTAFLGGQASAANKLKESGTTHWQRTKKGDINVSDFTALPGGCRGGRFLYMGKTGFWWTSSENSETTAWTRTMFYNFSKVTRDHFYKISGSSVRCIKD